MTKGPKTAFEALSAPLDFDRARERLKARLKAESVGADPAVTLHNKFVASFAERQGHNYKIQCMLDEDPVILGEWLAPLDKPTIERAGPASSVDSRARPIGLKLLGTWREEERRREWLKENVTTSPSMWEPYKPLGVEYTVGGPNQHRWCAVDSSSTRIGYQVYQCRECSATVVLPQGLRPFLSEVDTWLRNRSVIPNPFDQARRDAIASSCRVPAEKAPSAPKGA